MIGDWPNQCFQTSINPVVLMAPVSSSNATLLSDFPIAPPETIAYQGKEAARPKRGPFIIPSVLALLSLAGIALAFWLRSVPAGYPDPRATYNVFYVLFARHEPAGLLIVALFNVAAAFFFWKRRASGEVLDQSNGRPALVSVLVAVVVFAVAIIGTSTVFHDYLLTADENLADFQAKIFLHGKVRAEVPAAWAPAAYVIRAIHTEYSPATHLWTTNYLPVYAAMRALFQAVDLQVLLNPLLAAISILALYGVARNIWPESKTNALVAVGLLGSSSQFLVMSMTAYAMPAHLAFNTIWLWLYSRPERRSFYLAPFVGVMAIGLHQPVVHAVFVLPFLARLVWQRRLRPVLIFGAVYLAGCAAWYAWRMHFSPPTESDGFASIFRLANARMVVIQPMNLLLIIAWASLTTPLLAVLGFKSVLVGRDRRARRVLEPSEWTAQRSVPTTDAGQTAFAKDPFLQDCALSCVLTFGFYYFFYLDQAHGWGYRYFHGALACLVIVAVAGFNQLSILIEERRALNFVVAGIVFSILVQLPLRCLQAERFVRPYARASESASCHACRYRFAGSARRLVLGRSRPQRSFPRPTPRHGFAISTDARRCRRSGEKRHSPFRYARWISQFRTVHHSPQSLCTRPL